MISFSSTRGRLLSLIATIAIPAMAITIYLSFRYADAERRVIEARRFDEVTNLTFLIDGQIRAVETALNNMAGSATLIQNDFKNFRPIAERALSNLVP